MDKDSIEWKDYEMSVNLHRSYLDFAVKMNLFYYAITGAILSFHFSKDSNSISIFALLLPILLSFSLGGFYLYAAKLAYNLRGNIRLRAKALGIDFYPEGIVLVVVCSIFGLTSLVVGFGLLFYFCCSNLAS